MPLVCSAKFNCASLLRSAASVCLRAVISRVTLDAPIILPPASLMGDTVTETSIRLPSFVRRTVSKCCTLSPRLMRDKIISSSPNRSGGMSRLIEPPTISTAVKPKTFSAPAFQKVTMPSRFLPMMASSEYSTIAASRSAAASVCLRTLIFSCATTTRTKSWLPKRVTRPTNQRCSVGE